TATNRGITVASQAVGAAPQVKLALPPEVDGEIRIALVDPAQSPPEVLQESLAYRQPRRELKIALQDLKSHYAPGEQVRLKVAIRDENDRPAQAAVGVRVWNEALVKATGDEPVLLADAVRHAGQSEYEIAEQPASVALGGGAANFRGMTKDSDALAMLPAQAAAKQQADKKAPPTGNAQPTANAPAAEAPPAGQAALGLEQQDKLERFHKEVTEFAAQPALEGDRAQLAELPGENGSPVIGNSLTSGPLVVSNRATVELESQVRTEQLRDQWHDWQQLLGRVLLAGGVLLLAVLGALGLMRYPLRTSSGMMGAVAAAAGIVVGLAWINVGPVAERQMAAVAVDGTSVAPAAPSNSTGEAFTTESYPAGDAADFVAPVVVPPARPLADDSFADRDEHREKANLAQAGPAGRAKSGRDDDHAADRPAKGGELFGGKLAGSLPAGGGVGGASGGGGRGGSPAEPQSKPAAAASDKPTSREKLEELSASSPTPGLTATTPAANPATSAPATSAPATSAPAISAPAPGAGPVVVDALKDDQSRQAAGEAAKRSRESDPSGAPAALYFNPQLMADEQGHAVIEFEMPAVPSTYRLLIDVYGNGRLGGMQTLLECKPPRPADQK
ncbi:MAG: hypothetical protein SFU86_00840, partial [Pirellulaceae bacterium]|nr:hypothetical protein [Pirellulaceae bacterium]